MSFASFVDDLAEGINAGIRAFTDSQILPKAVGKATRFGLNVGKPIANTGFKVGMGVINKGLDSANFIKDNREAIGKGLKAFGKSVVGEANEIAQAGAGVVELVDRSPFLKKVPLKESLIGRSVTKPGVALAFGVSLAMGTGEATKDYIDNRQGQNDGRLYGTTPQLSTPYQLSEQMAYSSLGRSFVSNGGADGDLVKALYDMK
jgi:hypothetical protein